MSKYIDSNGILYLWGKIKALVAGKVNAVSGKQLSTNDYSDADKNKLAGVAIGANAYAHPTGDGNGHVPATGAGSNGKFLRAGTTAGSAAWTPLDKEDVTTALGYTPPATDTKYTHPGYTARAAGLYKVTVDASGHVSTAAAATKADITALGIPGQDTTYGAMTPATQGVAGGSGLVPAPAAGKQDEYLRGDGTWATPQNTTYGVATASADGLLPKADKAKLDGFGEAASYALKTDVIGVYKYKGSKATVANLPASANTVGDIWDVAADGMNYAWNGTAWDPLGAAFSIESMTNADIDAIVAS